MIKHAAIACLAVACCACTRGRPRDEAVRVDTLMLADIDAGRLPVSVLCYFPHMASWSEKRRLRDCPAGSRATRTYASADVAGCWMLRDFRGEPLSPEPPFNAPVRLLAARTPEMDDRGHAPDEFAAEFLAEPPDEARMRQALHITSTWRLSAPDSLTLTRAHGYGALVFWFRVRGDRLVGFKAFHADAGPFTRLGPWPHSPEAVVGTRVPCPPGSR